MFSHFRSANPSPSISLTLQDLLDEHGGRYLSDYLALSVRRVGEDTVISLTTTGTDPVTYSTVIASAEAVDWASLVFVAQDA